MLQNHRKANTLHANVHGAWKISKTTPKPCAALGKHPKPQFFILENPLGVFFYNKNLWFWVFPKRGAWFRCGFGDFPSAVHICMQSVCFPTVLQHSCQEASLMLPAIGWILDSVILRGLGQASTWVHLPLCAITQQCCQGLPMSLET